MTNRYAIFVIPAAHLVAANAFLAVYHGDDPALSRGFSQGANLDGVPGLPENPFSTATHFYGGMPATEAWVSDMSNMATAMVQPAGGWPIVGVSEAQAIAAAEAMHLEVTIVQDGSSPNPQLTLASALGALGLMKIVPPPEE